MENVLTFLTIWLSGSCCGGSCYSFNRARHITAFTDHSISDRLMEFRGSLARTAGGSSAANFFGGVV